MRHLIVATVQNRAGVVAHISALFSARGFNIDSFTASRTEDPAISRITIVVYGDNQIIEQVIKQLRKVIDVIKVQDMSDLKYIERDLLLLKVNTPPGKRNEVMELVSVFRAKVVDVTAKDVVIELSGSEDKLEAIISLMQQYGIKELTRTGSIAMQRGRQ